MFVAAANETAGALNETIRIQASATCRLPTAARAG